MISEKSASVHAAAAGRCLGLASFQFFVAAFQETSGIAGHTHLFRFLHFLERDLGCVLEPWVQLPL